MTASDRILGLIGGAMIAAALGLLVFGAIRPDGASPADLPALRLVTPADGAVLQAPLTLTFLSEVPLSRGPGGWGTGEYHVHAQIDDVEVMPGPSDIERGTDGTYRWTIPAAGSGEMSIRLFWSDGNHVPVVGADQVPISVRIMDGAQGGAADGGQTSGG